MAKHIHTYTHTHIHTYTHTHIHTYTHTHIHKTHMHERTQGDPCTNAHTYTDESRLLKASSGIGSDLYADEFA
jgi:hypothetical protein